MLNKTTIIVVVAIAAAWSGLVSANVPSWGTTLFSNVGGIVNTRHNMTQSGITGTANGVAARNDMDRWRNDYAEVCVYCHTPHGANTTKGAMPLWNRTLKNNTYNTYNQLGTSTITQTFSAPGANSLTCLSCHDGTTAIDAVLNMPGSGPEVNGAPNGNFEAISFTQPYKRGYYAAMANQQGATEKAFLNSWKNPAGRFDSTTHGGLNSQYVSTTTTWVNGGPSSQNIQNSDPTAIDAAGCMVCHSPAGAGFAAGATDFSIFYIGTDLRNDHPVGVTFPMAGNPGPGGWLAADFNQPTGTKTTALGTTVFFDDGDGVMEKGEIRMYDTGQGPEVECASCHDPHGVAPSAGLPFYRSFLRKNQDGSAVCLTCHIK
ncbi:MAG: cytochrome c3 family protein [Pseudomonadota bacterium]